MVYLYEEFSVIRAYIVFVKYFIYLRLWPFFLQIISTNYLRFPNIIGIQINLRKYLHYTRTNFRNTFVNCTNVLFVIYTWNNVNLKNTISLVGYYDLLIWFNFQIQLMKIVILDKMSADSQCCNFINTFLLLFLYIGDVFSDVATGKL